MIIMDLFSGTVRITDTIIIHRINWYQIQVQYLYGILTLTLTLTLVQRPNLWLKHVKGHTNRRWNNRCDRLADDGRTGRCAYDTVVD